MTAGAADLEKRCWDCLAWVKLSEADGGIGICDNTLSEHSQHVIGFAHPACGQWMKKPPAKRETERTNVKWFEMR